MNRFLVWFAEILPIQIPNSTRTTPQAHTLHHLNRITLTFLLHIFSIVIHFVDIYFKSLVIKHEKKYHFVRQARGDSKRKKIKQLNLSTITRENFTQTKSSFCISSKNYTIPPRRKLEISQKLLSHPKYQNFPQKPYNVPETTTPSKNLIASNLSKPQLQKFAYESCLSFWFYIN